MDEELDEDLDRFFLAIWHDGRAAYKVAGEAGLSPARLSRILRRRVVATDQERRSLARVLGVPVEEIF